MPSTPKTVHALRSPSGGALLISSSDAQLPTARAPSQAGALGPPESGSQDSLCGPQ